MKKSECFRLAQEVVINSDELTTEAKVEILRVLIDKEDIELYVEKKNETEEGTDNG